LSRLNLDIFDTLFLFFSWYLKPLLFDTNTFVSIQLICISLFTTLLLILIKLGAVITSPAISIFASIKLTSYLSIFMGIKFVILIGLLIVVRGGIPRYRYDFLTKLG